MAAQGERIEIDIDQLALDLKNYRHKPVKKPADAIAHLVKADVVDLALDIAAEGFNPLESLGVVEGPGDAERAEYISVEGNRRVCAILLLHDPEKLPSGIPNRPALVKKLQKAGKKANFPDRLSVILFASKKQAKPWIDRLHLPKGDGRTRKRWTPEQQDRAMGKSGGRNRDAIELLDLAQSLSLISQQERDS